MRSPATRYENRNITNMWISEDARVAFGLASARVQPGDPGVAAIVVKEGWFLLLGGGGRQRWVSPDVVIAFEFAGQAGFAFEDGVR